MSQVAEERRQLLEQQDMEYVLSEQTDAEKERLKALKEEESKRLFAFENERRASLLDTLRKKHASLPPIPSEVSQHILELSVMIPELEHGTSTAFVPALSLKFLRHVADSKSHRVSRKWNAEVDTLEDVYLWVETLALSENGSHYIPQVFTLRSDFPRVQYIRSEATRTLELLGLTGRVILHIEETFNESS
jgi:hypothetical protein